MCAHTIQKNAEETCEQQNTEAIGMQKVNNTILQTKI